ncbi:hypothetical protein KKA69_01280, partial [Patescibacteria group bacterium]|nr:hypothetical protein [Patescibacteria group bacterium]
MIKQENKKVSRLFCVLFGVCFAMAPLIAEGAMLYLMPQSQTVYQGDTFIVELRLDTEGEEINAVKVNLIFPPDRLKVVDVNRGGSVLILWPEEPFYSNENGALSFTGGIPQGFKDEGKLFMVT